MNGVKIREKHDNATLIYIPPAGKPIRKSFLSRTLLYFLIGLFFLTSTSLIVGQIHVYVQSGKKISFLNQYIQSEQEQHEQMMIDKDRTLEELKLNIFDLSQTAESLELKLKNLKMLEMELKRLSDEVNMNLNIPNIHTPTQAEGLGGESIAVEEKQIQELMDETQSSFVILENELEQLTYLLSVSHASLEKIEETQRHMPSIWPTPSNYVSSRYGIRRDPFSQKLSFHNGIDIAGDRDDQIYAAADGIIETADWDPVKGNYIQIKHTDELNTVYMHLRKITVKKGDSIKKGESIGFMGSTGRSTGVHLHYEVHLKGQNVNPMQYIQK
jgi:murein DD-endopeptidase MepM/ murein hydrolase activator NlpD